MTTTRILVVEDDPFISDKLEIQLADWGYDIVSIISSGEEAVDMAAQLLPDLIIMDIMLSGDMDGIEAARIIHENHKIPVIYATSQTDETFFKRSKTTEPFGYLIKPIEEKELEITIRIALYHSQLESRLIKNERHLSDAQRIGLLGSWEWDIKNNTLNWSDQMFRIFGQEPQSFGADYNAFMMRVHADDRSHVQMAVDSALAGEKHFCTSYRVVTTDGTINRIQADGEVTFDADGSPTRMIGTAQDISAIMQTQDDLWHLAHHDPLTGLANRNLLSDRIGQALSHANREKKQIAIMMIDLDYFKNINDEFGHDSGDDYLRKTSARISQTLRDDDTLARLGGDEFVVVASIFCLEDAAKVSRKILDAINMPLPLKGTSVTPSASIGIALYPEHGHDIESLLKAADEAMYEAKHQGKNTYSIHQSEKTKAHNKPDGIIIDSKIS